MSARAGRDARALLAGSPRVRVAVPLLVEAAEPGQRVALVGGVVRDLLRGEESREIDVVVEGDGIAYAERLGTLTGSAVRAYSAFGTATVDARPPVDVASARRETYPQSGDLPHVVPATIEEDLARRDFTINAIAAVVVGPDAGALIDPFDGVADVAAGVVRLLRPDAFEEDATRLVRAARYTVRLGATPDATLVHAAGAAAHGGFPALTGTARMIDALSLVFDEADPASVVELLATWGVLTAVEPGLGVDPTRLREAWTLVEEDARDADRVALGLGLLASGLPEDRRPEWLAAGGLARSSIRAALAAAASAELGRQLEGAGDADVDAICGRVPLEGVIAAGGDEAARYLGRLRHIRLAVDGNDVQRVTGAVGPDVGRTLIDLRRARIDGTAAADRESQLAWLAAR